MQCTFEQLAVTRDFLELPVALPRLLFTDRAIGILIADAGIDETQAPVVLEPVANQVHQELGVVLAVLFNELRVVVRDAQACGDARRIGVRIAVALDPPG